MCFMVWHLHEHLCSKFEAINKWKDPLRYPFFKNIFWRTQVLFVGPLIPLFWTSGDVFSGFQSQSGQPYLHLMEAYMLHVLRDYSPLVWYLTTSWQLAWHLSQSLAHTCEQALVGLETGIYLLQTNVLPTELSRHGSTKVFCKEFHIKYPALVFEHRSNDSTTNFCWISFSRKLLW